MRLEMLQCFVTPAESILAFVAVPVGSSKLFFSLNASRYPARCRTPEHFQTSEVESFVDMFDPVVRFHDSWILENGALGAEWTVQVGNRLRRAFVARTFNRFESVF